MRLEPRCCRTSIWYTIFCSGGGGTGRYPEHGTCFDKYIHPLLAIYSSPFGKFGCEPFGRAAPYKKGVLTYQFFMFWKDPPRSYKKGVRSYHRHFFTPSKGKVHRPWSFCRELLLVGNRLL